MTHPDSALGSPDFLKHHEACKASKLNVGFVVCFRRLNKSRKEGGTKLARNLLAHIFPLHNGAEDEGKDGPRAGVPFSAL